MDSGTPRADPAPGRPEFEVAALVIGGGFFGAALARQLGRTGRRVLLVERAAGLLTRASYTNQARVHLGYHYPRSFLTASRSLRNAPRFRTEFADCVVDDFAHYYAIGRTLSKVNARQFEVFCRRIGAPLAPAPAAMRRQFNPALIEDVFAVPEPAFDADKLRARLTADLADAGVDVRLDTEAVRVAPGAGGRLRTTLVTAGQAIDVEAPQVFNCTYSRLNGLLAASGLPLIPLKHELAEMVLIEPPPLLAHAAVTVMCGPFFSCMPFPARGLHTLSHVRYTPHRSWIDDPARPWHDPLSVMASLPPSHAPAMVRDATRYLPAFAGCRVVESMWEVKSILPRSEVDDSRPILLKAHHGLPGLTCIAGAKVDNIYDLFDSDLLEPAPALGGPA
jgi:glycine/D-amino acid oxidase-like deaminating enzyme